MRVDRECRGRCRSRTGSRPPRRAPRSRWRGRPRPRPWHCRSPRRTGDAAPSRRCRRRTCRAGAGRARGLPAPRCRRPCSCRSCRRACGRHEPLSLSPPVSPEAPVRPLPSRLRARPAPREVRAPLPAAPPASSALARACRAWTGRIDRTGRARHERLAWVSSPHDGVIIAVQANATHRGAAAMANPSNPKVRSRRTGRLGWQECLRNT